MVCNAKSTGFAKSNQGSISSICLTMCSFYMPKGSRTQLIFYSHIYAQLDSLFLAKSTPNFTFYDFSDNLKGWEPLGYIAKVNMSFLVAREKIACFACVTTSSVIATNGLMRFNPNKTFFSRLIISERWFPTCAYVTAHEKILTCVILWIESNWKNMLFFFKKKYIRIKEGKENQKNHKSKTKTSRTSKIHILVKY